MIKNPDYFEAWEREYIAHTPVVFLDNLRIFDMLLEEARMLGVLPLKDPLEGIEEKIIFARMINGSKYPPDNGSCP